MEPVINGSNLKKFCILLPFLFALYEIVIAGRQERALPLVYPNGGIWKFNIGFGTPVKYPNRTIIMGLQFQFQYAHVRNISELTQFFSLFFGGRGSTYSMIQSAMNRVGINGRSCLLRAICEAAETPMFHDGLFGELLHLLLTPGRNEKGLEQHVKAHDLGETEGDCLNSYPECPLGTGLLDSITRLVHF